MFEIPSHWTEAKLVVQKGTMFSHKASKTNRKEQFLLNFS